jgi:hypothetical protein
VTIENFDHNMLIILLRHLKGVRGTLIENLRLIDQHIGGIEWALTKHIENDINKGTT